MTSKHPLRSRSVLVALFLLATVWTISLGAQTVTKPTTKATTSSTSSSTKTKKVSVKTIDINSASETEMAPLGIDSTMAKKIIAGRPYRNKRDILTKQFVTADQYAKIKDLIVARQKKG